MDAQECERPMCGTRDIISKRRAKKPAQEEKKAKQRTRKKIAAKNSKSVASLRRFFHKAYDRK